MNTGTVVRSTGPNVRDFHRSGAGILPHFCGAFRREVDGHTDLKYKVLSFASSSYGFTT